MPKDFYYFDTINATKNYDSVLSVSNGIYNHPYNIYFPLKAPIRNLKRITLKSVEMPLNLYTTRIENNTTNIGLTFSYTSSCCLITVHFCDSSSVPCLTARLYISSNSLSCLRLYSNCVSKS